MKLLIEIDLKANKSNVLRRVSAYLCRVQQQFEKHPEELFAMMMQGTRWTFLEDEQEACIVHVVGESDKTNQ